MGLRSWLAQALIQNNQIIVIAEDVKTQTDKHDTLVKTCAEQKTNIEAVMHDLEHIYEFLNKKFRNAERNRREPLSVYVKSVIAYLEQQHDREFEIFVNLYTSNDEDKQQMLAYWRTIVADRATTRNKAD